VLLLFPLYPGSSWVGSKKANSTKKKWGEGQRNKVSVPLPWTTRMYCSLMMELAH
jgi:hypothetical protein